MRAVFFFVPMLRYLKEASTVFFTLKKIFSDNKAIFLVCSLVQDSIERRIISDGVGTMDGS